MLWTGCIGPVGLGDPAVQFTPEASDAQVEALIDAVRGKRIGLITNPTGVDHRFRPIIDLLAADPEINVAALFGPEHGLRGARQAGGGVGDAVDSVTGATAYSLYGTRRAPTDEQLAGLDALVFDIQDVGARFYTFIWTMTYAMEAAARNRVEFIVFDRPNPIGADKVEGAPIPFDAGLVGRVWPDQPFGVPTRHGMTVGEMAMLVNGEWLSPKVKLRVIPIPGYTRRTTFAESGYPWVMPSPNMPTLETARVYPGMCIFEGTNLSEGRGTTRPFELVGAPFIDGHDLALRLNKLYLAGVTFREAYFTPTFDDYKGELCGGIQVHVTDPDRFEPIRAALHVLKTAYQRYPDQIVMRSYVSTLMGVRDLPERIKSQSVDEIIRSWQDDLAAFNLIRRRYLLYPDHLPRD